MRDRIASSGPNGSSQSVADRLGTPAGATDVNMETGANRPKSRFTPYGGRAKPSRMNGAVGSGPGAAKTDELRIEHVVSEWNVVVYTRMRVLNDSLQVQGYPDGSEKDVVAFITRKTKVNFKSDMVSEKVVLVTLIVYSTTKYSEKGPI